MEDVEAILSDGLLPGNSSNPLRGPVEGSNPPFSVDGEDSVSDALQDGGELQLIQRALSAWLLFFQGGFYCFLSKLLFAHVHLFMGEPANIK